MNVSPVGSPAGYVPPVRPQAAASPPAADQVKVGRDADGDNDGSKGGTVDVRA